ncbi:MAG: hypothetical protein MUE41_09255, partial [Gemmatimonadaceae bacterium]|nr:hypothetical protein [Gemmatimonadaceae bacterium]
MTAEVAGAPTLALDRVLYRLGDGWWDLTQRDALLAEVHAILAEWSPEAIDAYLARTERPAARLLRVALD